MQPLPVAIDIGNSFYPLSVTPATSSTEYLPLGCSANCLLAGPHDPRRILYTIFSEQDNGILSHDIRSNCSGFSRVYDITCCDSEPAGLGIPAN